MEEALKKAQQQFELLELQKKGVESALDSIEKATERLQKLGLKRSHAAIVAAAMFEIDLHEGWFIEEPSNTSRPRVAA